jgi:hypothetical protein
VIRKEVVAEISKEPFSAAIETRKIILFADREHVGAMDAMGKGNCIRLKVLDMLNLLNTSLEDKK